MPSYKYAARDQRGAAVNGTLAAPSPEALADQLTRMGYFVTSFREAAEGAAADGLLQRLRRVGAEDLVLLNVQLAKMVHVGIPLVGALDTLALQTEHPRLRRVVGEVAQAVEGGISFSQALSRHPAVFSPLFVNMVHAGEVSGKLDEVLRRLALFAKREAELNEQIKTASAYPKVLLAVGVGVITFLLAAIIPKFMKIFQEANVPLPLPTRLIYQLSELLRHHWLLLGFGLLTAVVGVRQALRTPSGRRLADSLLLRIPVVGELARKAVLSRLCRTLETLFSSGVPVLESLEIAEKTCGNMVLADVMRQVQESVKQGKAISEPLKAHPAFPPMVVQMIVVGEASGTLDQMLGEIAGHYDELVQHGIKRVTALMEPAFLMVMGAMVAFIMASILLPMFKMVNVVR